MEWVRSFDFVVSAADLWDALVGASPGHSWYVVSPRTSERELSWDDRDGDIGIEMSMRLSVTETETGSRVTITRSGFGDGDMFDIRQTSKLVGWSEAMHDLAVYAIRIIHLATGAFFIGASFAFMGPARQAWVVELVDEDELANAVALNRVALNAWRCGLRRLRRGGLRCRSSVLPVRTS